MLVGLQMMVRNYYYTKTAATWCIAMSLQLDSQDNEHWQSQCNEANWLAEQCR